VGAFVAVVFLLPAVGASASPPIPGTQQHRCEVGGSPAWYFPRIPPGVKRLSPIVTIACGRQLVGQPYEIVAVDTSEGLWVYADSGPIGFSEGQSVPPSYLLSRITVNWGWSGPPARSNLFGMLGPNVARVDVITISGCVPPKGIRAVAFDAEGQRIGSARPLSFIPHPCNPRSWFGRHS
jgi:hypothetical protein